MNLSILTYNVLFNKAYKIVPEILKKYSPDIVCLQEISTDEVNLKKLETLEYKLADFSNSFIKFGKIFGVATYYNAKKLKLVRTDALNLPKSVYEIITTIFKALSGGNKPRSILRTDFLLRENKKKIAVYNLHLSVFGINRTRTKQLKTILNHGILKRKLPTIIAGDFNYFPYRRKILENLMAQHGFFEGTKEIDYTIRYPNREFTKYSLVQELAAIIIRKFFGGRIKTDYFYYKNLQLIKSERIEIRDSDHFPILSFFEFRP